ncbi:glycosyl transferase family 1, partial [bacterium]|nr:glycosyl transferase family 1 [bacterium]
MDNLKINTKNIFVVGPTESMLTRRGNRHPALAQYLVDQGFSLEYVTSNFYHAEKRWFSSEEIAIAKQDAPYKLTVKQCIGYKANISFQRILSNILLSINFFFYLLPRLNKNSILILPSRPVEMIFAAAMLRLLRNVTVALDIQDIWPDMLVVRSKVKKLFFTLYCNIYL